MKTALVAIGNSKGIRISKTILEQCHFTKEVDLLVQGDTIILKSIKSKARQGWDEAFQDMHKNGEDRLLIDDALDLEVKDWQW